MASTDRSWRLRGNAKDMPKALQTEVSNLLEKPSFAAQLANSENQNPSYNREEQNTFIEAGAFARRYLRQIQLARFKARIEAVSKAQEAGQSEEDGAPEINLDKLKVPLESVAVLSPKAATDCLRQGRSAPSVQELREALMELESLVRKEIEGLSIVKKDEKEQAGATSNDFSVAPVVGDAAPHTTVEVQQQQRHADLDSQNDQDEKKLVIGQDQLPRTPQTRKRQMSLLSPGQHQRPAKKRSNEILSTAADDKME
ncbi:hypothetical protein NW759_017038 [Fusarium solani]|nr:hypothetical protein NW759_017038 [Fusarium solani]